MHAFDQKTIRRLDTYRDVFDRFIPQREELCVEQGGLKKRVGCFLGFLRCARASTRAPPGVCEVSHV